ncbi:MAG: hypothetical protein PUE68_01750 [Kiritimatiellae bacterium]|nr:hypothetical protein [Kiritimatiellia bacterium]
MIVFFIVLVLVAALVLDLAFLSKDRGARVAAVLLVLGVMALAVFIAWVLDGLKHGIC